MNNDEPVGVFEPGPNARPILDGPTAGGFLILPDPDAEPGEWSPFDRDLEAEGWHKIGAMTDDGVQQ